eukprot:PLAT10651.1.p1 GENE.PLAT10651.1~~PLAT10651.1.p1  ORF type:complete len:351 (-),score=148.03 PLAT10651.1:73-1125(-)
MADATPLVGTLIELGFDPELAAEAAAASEHMDAALAYIEAKQDAEEAALTGEGGDAAEVASPAPMDVEDEEEAGDVGDGVLRSFKCDDCGKMLRTEASVQLHAERTEHQNFSQSAKAIADLTPEEKAAQIERLQAKLKEKRAAREVAEKAADKERELRRRTAGRSMGEVREKHERMARERDARARRKEKERQKKERTRLRRQLAMDKWERQRDRALREGREPPPKPTFDDSSAAAAAGGAGGGASLSPYMCVRRIKRNDGDVGKALKTLRIYVKNLLENPEEEKFQSVNKDNAGFKRRVACMDGGEDFLRAVGFTDTVDADGRNLLSATATDERKLRAGLRELEGALGAM